MDQSELTIAFIGGGNMAQALLSGLLHAGHEPAALRVADPAPAQRDRAGRLHPGLRVDSDNASAAAAADVLVLAVKPQVLASVCRTLQPLPSQLVISVAAGVTLGAIATWMGEGVACVRVMPNQPALVGAGMSVLCANAAVSQAQRAQADYLARAGGAVAWVEDEALMDAVTAISGSGPAYFYLLMEILEEAAQAMGIPAEVARQLAVQTAFGAGLTARETGSPPEALRRMVTSPGGTTQAALETLERGNLSQLFTAALEAARQRSVELGHRDDL
jgi:pyrroline-5-carboxylate reductase